MDNDHQQRATQKRKKDAAQEERRRREEGEKGVKKKRISIAKMMTATFWSIKGGLSYFLQAKRRNILGSLTSSVRSHFGYIDY